MSNGVISGKVGQAKAWFRSKTIIGVIIAFIPTVIKFIKPEWTIDLEGGVEEVFNGAEQLALAADQIWVQVMEVVGSALAIWGRLKAKVGISGVPGAKTVDGTKDGGGKS